MPEIAIVHKTDTEGPFIMLVWVGAIIIVFQLVPVICRTSARILNGRIYMQAFLPSQDGIVSSTTEDICI